MRNLVWMLVLGGCASENNLYGDKNDPPAPAPDIAVRPNLIDFGTLAIGDTATDVFQIKNQGDGDLHIDDIRLEGDASFTFVTSDLHFSLAPGEIADIEVAFTPDHAQNDGQAYIDSNDPDEPTKEVDLTGFSAVPELEVSPDPLDMGETWVGCELDNTLTLTNIGGAPLTIESLDHDGDGFVFRSDLEFPLVLDVGESREVSLLFTPTDDHVYSGVLTAVSNEPLSPREALQTGTGVYADPLTETWEIPTDPPSDIVFFVDHSCSMDDDARAVASNFSTFISELGTYTNDWHVIVAVDDDGCNTGGILSPSVADYEQRFTDAATNRSKGVWTEAGMTISAHAVDETDSGECNAGFLREEALLHLILVSDEAEQSLGGWEAKLDEIIAKKGDASLVKVSAIAGDYPRGCSTGSNSADPGVGYYEATQATGGEFLSICSNWSSDVGLLANASVERSSFTLEEQAIGETVTVTVNGVARTSGWTYDTTSNTVTFSTGIPSEGDTVEISYSTYTNCDR